MLLDAVVSVDKEAWRWWLHPFQLVKPNLFIFVLFYFHFRISSLTVYLRLTLHLWSSCLGPLKARITSVCLWVFELVNFWKSLQVSSKENLFTPPQLHWLMREKWENGGGATEYGWGTSYHFKAPRCYSAGLVDWSSWECLAAEQRLLWELGGLWDTTLC